MLTTIPKKYFKNLISENISESEDKVFSIDEFKKFVADSKRKNTSTFKRTLNNEIFEEQVKGFMRNNSNVKYIDEGSSRIAYLMPPHCIREDISAPCCLKVAKNQQGIAQNKAEYSLFKRYGKLPCFPRIFDYDVSRNLYTITELGMKCDSDFIDAYADTWNELVEQKKLKKGNRFSEFKRKINNYNTGNQYNVNDIINYTEYFTPKNVKHIKVNYGLFLNDIVLDIVKSNPAFQTMEGLLEFAHSGGYEQTSPEDLKFIDNWAIIIRDYEETPLPIDWGFSWEVADKYY